MARERKLGRNSDSGVVAEGGGGERKGDKSMADGRVGSGI